MKKLHSIVKVSLLGITLAVLGLSAFPSHAKAEPGDIWILCEDRANICAEDADYYYLGRFWGIGIEM